jgi:hypothetical protein
LTVLRSSADVFALVDELGPSAVGEIVLGADDGARGAVFVERGRVCWAAAHGLAPRLTELLIGRASIPPLEMEGVFRRCKAERKPLGEHLIQIGALAPVDLREALMQHTVESLRLLCQTPACATWFPRPGNGYSPKFTFTTAELLVHAGAERNRDIASAIRPILTGTFDDGDWAAAFVRNPNYAFPEPIATFGTPASSTRALVRLGKWAASVLDVIAAFNDEGALLALARPNGALVAFRHGAAVVVGETGEHGPARILNRRARERRNQRSGDAHL